jgi:molybdopterin-binding protein
MPLNALNQLMPPKACSPMPPEPPSIDGKLSPSEGIQSIAYRNDATRRNAMKLSARNVLPATVKAVKPGAVDTEVVVELAPGLEMVSIITKQSAEKLGLKPGAKAYAIVKASSVMIGVD